MSSLLSLPLTTLYSFFLLKNHQLHLKLTPSDYTTHYLNPPSHLQHSLSFSENYSSWPTVSLSLHNYSYHKFLVISISTQIIPFQHLGHLVLQPLAFNDPAFQPTSAILQPLHHLSLIPHSSDSLFLLLQLILSSTASPISSKTSIIHCSYHLFH